MAAPDGRGIAGAASPASATSDAPRRSIASAERTSIAGPVIAPATDRRVAETLRNLERADVAGNEPQVPTLVGLAEPLERDLRVGRAPSQKGVREGRATVVLERSELRVDADLVAQVGVEHAT